MKHSLKKGGLGVIALVVIILITSVIMLLDTYERHTLYLKRQNLQNVLTSANLTLYNSVRKGEASILVPVQNGQQIKSKYSPQQVKDFLSLLNQPNEEQAIISKYGSSNNCVELKNDLLNLMAISYLKPEYNYKCLYIDKDEALEEFASYLEKNLDVKRVAGMSNMAFISTTNSKFIEEIKINSFYVRNAVNCWDENVSGTGCCDYVANSENTCVHIDMTIKIRTFTHLDQIKSRFRYSGTTEMPMHIDTVIDYNNI